MKLSKESLYENPNQLMISWQEQKIVYIIYKRVQDDIDIIRITLVTSEWYVSICRATCIGKKNYTCTGRGTREMMTPTQGSILNNDFKYHHLKKIQKFYSYYWQIGSSITSK